MKTAPFAALLALALAGAALAASDTPASETKKIPAFGAPGFFIAHRGGKAEFDENTLSAFRSAYENGIRGFETDIRLSADGHFFILHDDSLERTTLGTGNGENKTAAELREITTRKGNPLAFLDDLLDYLADKPGVYLEIEMKTSNKKLYPDSAIENFAAKAVAAVKAKTPPGSRYLLTSFDIRPLAAIHKIDPSVETALITRRGCDEELIEKARSVGARALATHINHTTRAQLRAARKAGLRVTLWPGLKMTDHTLATLLGGDIHCTDHPVALARWLAAQPPPPAVPAQE